MSVNTKTSLDTMFKRSVADKVNKLMPSTAIIQKLIPEIEAREKLGREYLQPVALTFEHGVTYGDGTAFTLNDPIAGVYTEAKVTSDPVVLRSQVSQSAANRMANDEKAFLNWAALRAEVMKSSLAKRAELAMLYGKSGLATLASATDGGTDVATFVITDATWAAAIWGGMEGASIEVRNGASLVATATITSVDAENKSLVVAGTESELDNVTTGYKLYFKGSYANDMYGLDSIITNSGTLFNISASDYQLWKGNSHIITGGLTFGKILAAVSKPVARGGLDQDVIALVPSKSFEDLNAEYAAYRTTDASYKAAKGMNGVQSIQYHCQAGMIDVVPHPFVKEGEAFVMPKDALKRIGATDITFNTGAGSSGEAEFFLPLNGAAGYELRCQYDFAVFCEAPAKTVKITGIGSVS